MLACGVVAFFDILGYKQFLRHNPCDDASAFVVRTIAEAKTAVLSNILSTVADEKDADILIQHAKSITWVIFSDTIMLLCPFEQSISPVNAVRRWHAVIISAQILSKYMFEEGLPLQGCIAYGEFIHEQNCFAGRTVLDAYEIAGKIPFAGSVFTSVAFEELQRVAEPFALQQDITAKILLMASIVNFEIELNGRVQQMPTLNFLTVNGIQREQSAWYGSYYEIVHRSFTKHNKPLEDKAYAKAQQTAEYLATLDSKFPGALTNK